MIYPKIAADCFFLGIFHWCTQHEHAHKIQQLLLHVCFLCNVSSSADIFHAIAKIHSNMEAHTLVDEVLANRQQQQQKQSSKASETI